MLTTTLPQGVGTDDAHAPDHHSRGRLPRIERPVFQSSERCREQVAGKALERCSIEIVEGRPKCGGVDPAPEQCLESVR